jgi:hypothetical protein
VNNAFSGASVIVDPGRISACENSMKETGGITSAVDFVGQKAAPLSAFHCCAKTGVCFSWACSSGRSQFHCRPCHGERSASPAYSSTLPSSFVNSSRRRAKQAARAERDGGYPKWANNPLDDLRAEQNSRGVALIH